MVDEDILSRLRAIERTASAARRQAAADCEEVGLVLELTTDLRYIVAAHICASVEAYPNLIRNAEHLAGLLEWCGASPRIVCEAHDPLVRQRFSIAHELGHYHLHARAGAARYSCSQSQVDPEATSEETATSDGPVRGLRHELEHGPDAEAEADAFAAAFLVPEETLTADVARFGRCIAFLAERYRVSEAAMRKRMSTLERLSA
jgi:hypothetical protein